MFPDSTTLKRLEGLMNAETTYYEVRCYQCWFTESSWLPDEAQLRGQIHEAGNDGHETEYVEVVLGDDPPDELGFGDGGFAEEMGDD